VTEPAGQPLKAAVSPVVNFTTYNQFVFLNFIDASIAHTDAGTAHGTSQQANVTQNASVREWNLALVAFTVLDNQNGTSSPSTTVTRINVIPQSAMTPD